MADKMDLLEKYGIMYLFDDAEDIPRLALERCLEDKFHGIVCPTAKTDLIRAGYRLYERAVACPEIVSAIDAALAVAKPVAGGNAVYLDDALRECGTLRSVENRLQDLKKEMRRDVAIFLRDEHDLVDLWSRGETVADDEGRPHTDTRTEVVLLGICIRTFDHMLDVACLVGSLAGDAASIALERGLVCDDVDDDCALGLLCEVLDKHRESSFHVLCLIDPEDSQAYHALTDFDISDF